MKNDFQNFLPQVKDPTASPSIIIPANMPFSKLDRSHSHPKAST